METVKYEFLLEAAEPVAHHAESLGNEAILMRRKVRLRDGAIVNIPCITGDTMRHGMREAAAYAMLDAAGVPEGGLSEAALRLLFAGGMVTGSNDGAIRLEEFREMCDLIPTMALFGGCARNRVIPGRLRVSDGTLVCRETWHCLPPWARSWCGSAADEAPSSVESQRLYVEEVQRVRMDPTLDPGKRKLLSAAGRDGAENRLLASEAASADGDARGKEGAKSSAMPRRFERLIQGSLFYWRVEADVYSDLDRDTLNVAVASFLYSARVGGKRGTGHGLLRAVAAQHATLARAADRGQALDTEGLASSAGTLFRAHVAERSERIRKFLSNIDA
jgi:CRISPR type IV-associated protein Csf2